jgi:hypothetical protein
MLTRLATSEPTTVWYGLWDKVISECNLQAAFWAVWRNEGASGVDSQSVGQFAAQEQTELVLLCYVLTCIFGLPRCPHAMEPKVMAAQPGSVC